MSKLTRVLAVAITLILMAMSIVLISNNARFLFLMPFALPLGLLLTLMWLSIPRDKLRSTWNRLVYSWRFPSSMILITSWTLLWTLLPVCVAGRFPRPTVHDEFAYLLGADTIIHGRWTNPVPAGWEHFESFHITVSPTYQSKYQPGMSLMLALGQWMTNEPFVGVILALILAGNALAWMLDLWLPRRWALPMTLLAVIIMVDNWGSNYFIAGPLATFAGALQLGLLRRWMDASRYPMRWIDGFLWGLSLVVLAWTRPFEGLLFSLLLGAAMLVCVVRQKQFTSWLLRITPGMVLLLLPAAWFQAQYNQALTGSATKFPYFIHDQQYFISPPFLFQSLLPEPVYRHEAIRQFHQEMAKLHQQFHSPEMLPSIISFRFGMAWIHFGLLLWLIPMLVLPELWARQQTRWLLLLWLFFLGIIQVVAWFLPHYAAPAWPAWWIVIATGIRILRLWTWKGKQAGRFIVCFFIATTACYVLIEKMVIPVMFDFDWTRHKAQVTSQLLKEGSRHLVLVQYSADHSTGEEWVYNGAELAKEPILWARSMTPEKDRELMKLYPGRTVWMLKVNSNNDKLPIDLSLYKNAPDGSAPSLSK